MVKCELKPGDVVQITQLDPVFQGCLLVVEEVKSWGVQGYISPSSQKGQGLTYNRVDWEGMEYVGHIKEDVRVTERDGCAKMLEDRATLLDQMADSLPANMKDIADEKRSNARDLRIYAMACRRPDHDLDELERELVCKSSRKNPNDCKYCGSLTCQQKDVSKTGGAARTL